MDSGARPGRWTGAAGRLGLAGGLLLALTLLSVPVAVRIGTVARTAVLVDGFLRGEAGSDPDDARRAVTTILPPGASEPADLWRPPTPAPHRGLVLVPGLTPDGRRDSRVRAAARQLAGAGFAVLVPDLPALRAQRLDPADATYVRAAVDALAHEPGVPAGGLAVIAVSVGLAPAILALTEPVPDPRVGVLLALGGYADARHLIGYFTTGAFAFGPEGGRRPVDSHLAREFLLRNIGLIRDPVDRAAVNAVLTARGGSGAQSRPRTVGVPGPEGQAVLALIANRDPAQVEPLLAALPADTQRLLDRLSPSRYLSRFGGRLLWIHGREDPAIPYTESLHARAAAAPGRVRLAVIGLLGHVEGSPPTGRLAGDLLRLGLITYVLLRA